MEDKMSQKEFSLMIDLMVAVSKKCGEGELTKLLEKYQSDGTVTAEKTAKTE